HAHQPCHVERHEREMEADEPAPESGDAPALIQLEAECLWKPVIVAGDGPEQNTRDDDMMEMSDQEDAVVHLPIHSRQGQQKPGQAAEDESHHEADCPKHRYRE